MLNVFGRSRDFRNVQDDVTIRTYIRTYGYLQQRPLNLIP
jgi:hypothetical protein